LLTCLLVTDYPGPDSTMIPLHEVLTRLTVDRLKALLDLLPGASRVSKKDDLVRSVAEHLVGERLRATWGRLDETQRLAVAEALYAMGRVFHPKRFRAKYGRLPAFTISDKQGRDFYNDRPTALRLFLYSVDGRDIVPIDLAECLKAWVAEPEPTRLATLDSLPEGVGEAALTVRHTERDALMELSVMLRLVDQGRVRVGEKTGLPGAAALRLVTDNLANGDFYAVRPKQNDWDQEIGPIKAYAWPLLLQAGGLAQGDGARLALSKAGMKALGSAPAGVLRTLWKRWQGSTLLDEFSRVETIKGQKSKGRVMTALAPRRAAIDAALRLCPPGAWIEVDEFARFMQAEDYGLQVTHDPWKLYIADSNYGSLGYDGFHDWMILQGRYLLCLLFEYAATLGIVDVAYIDPDDARADFRGLWGTDELNFLSRYDGLLYFRLTPLGAFCLDLQEDYAPAPLRSSVRLSVLPGLGVEVLAGNLAAEEVLTLDTWADQTGDAGWRLDRPKALAAIEKGHDIEVLREFLQTRDDQPLPDMVGSFIDTCRRQGQALKNLGVVLLVECQSAEIADLIAAHKETAALCMRAGERYLAVRREQEQKFRTAIRILGYGMPV